MFIFWYVTAFIFFLFASSLQSGHAFKITHLFIPHQTGTPDSCDMQHEEELIFYQDKYDLITLGWIHVSHAYCFLNISLLLGQI